MARESYSCFLSRLPPVCRYSIAVCMRGVAGARIARRGQAKRLLLMRGQEVRFEGGELEGGMRPGISSLCGGHRC